MFKIGISIEAESHEDYKKALSIVSAGISTGDMKVKTTSAALTVESEDTEEEEETPTRKKRVTGPAKKPTPGPTKKPTVEELEEDETEAEDEEAPAKKPKKEAGVDLDAVRELAQEKNKTHKDEVKALVASYGAATVSLIPTKQLPEFYAKLQKIGSKKKAKPEPEEDEDFLN
jgi:pyruvate/2-oxoacid:ferredoxin oxidoreductase alpha subunit